MRNKPRSLAELDSAIHSAAWTVVDCIKTDGRHDDYVERTLKWASLLSALLEYRKQMGGLLKESK